MYINDKLKIIKEKKRIINNKINKLKNKNKLYKYIFLFINFIKSILLF